MANATYNVYGAQGINLINLNMKVYQLISAGTSNLSGFFVDADGNQLGASFSITITGATAVTFDSIYDTAFSVTTGMIPNITGAKFAMTGSNLYVGQGNLSALVMSGVNYPYIEPANWITFGDAK